MLHLVVFTYYWPPSGGPNVQRWLRLSSLLKTHGVRVSVITVAPEYAAYPLTDNSLEKLVAPDTNVYRTKAFNPFDFYKKFLGKGKLPAHTLASEAKPSLSQKLARFVRGNLLLPDPRRGWNSYALKQALELYNTDPFQLFVTAGPPHSTHLIGLKLKQKLKLPWLADFHDFWTTAPYLKQFYRTAAANYVDRHYEADVLAKADAFLTASNYSNRHWHERYPQRPLTDFHTTSMAYDSELFARPALQQLRQQPQPKFTITYTGAIAEYFAPEAFFEAVANLKQQLPDLPLLLRFVGVLPPILEKLVDKHQLRQNFEHTGYVPHTESVKYLLKSSVLFLVNPHFENEKIHIPGKLYEYLAADKPILNLTIPEAETAAIIARCKAGKTFSRKQSAAMTKWLAELAQQWQQQGHCNLSSNSSYKHYSYLNETNRLAELLHKMLAGGKSE
jgi:glycosyltransferase involved in cell wall biosynthesis